MKIPALLSFNPELQRGLWLELTPSRLIATPIVLFLLLGGLYAAEGPSVSVAVDTALIWLLLVLWGSRLAAESFGDEAVGRTWDTQRLSSQSPWELTLGKLGGGTAYTWYGAAICGLALIFLQPESAGQTFLSAVIGGLIAQSTAFFIMLALHQFDNRGRRTYTTLAQIAGIVVSWRNGIVPFSINLPARMGSSIPTAASTSWYGLSLDPAQFAFALQLLLVAWLIFGSMRIVRRELGFIDGPLGWALLSVFALFVTAGFVPREMANLLLAQSRLAPVMLSSGSYPWIAVETLTYIAVLGTPVSRVALAKLGAAFTVRDWRGVWRNLPIWVPSLSAAILAGLVASVRMAAWEFGDKTGSTPDGVLAPIPFVVFGFLMRDIALVYLLRLVYRRRTTAALLIMFVLLYAVPSPLLSHSGQALLLTLFVARPHSTIIGVLAPWLEASIAWFVVWRVLHRPARSRSVG